MQNVTAINSNNSSVLYIWQYNRTNKKNSHTGNRTRIGRVRACYPNLLDYMGFDQQLTIGIYNIYTIHLLVFQINIARVPCSNYVFG